MRTEDYCEVDSLLQESLDQLKEAYDVVWDNKDDTTGDVDEEDTRERDAARAKITDLLADIKQYGLAPPLHLDSRRQRRVDDRRGGAIQRELDRPCHRRYTTPSTPMNKEGIV